MIIFELLGTEEHAAYQSLAISNGSRQYDFLNSIVEAAGVVGSPFLSQHIIKALNFHAITCLHTSAGEYRPCEVRVNNHAPPAHYRVSALMEDFVNRINRMWAESDPVALAALVLWQLNHIHPFINGNGRTARAACYFVLCLQLGRILPGEVILPELIKRNRDEYVAALEFADQTFRDGQLDLTPLHALLVRLVTEQIESAAPASGSPVSGQF